MPREIMYSSGTIPDFKNERGLWATSLTASRVLSRTKSAKLWQQVLTRCKENGSFQKVHPTYEGVTNGFENFQRFADWCQYQKGYIENYALDKDLLVPCNKVYCEDACIFLPHAINSFIAYQGPAVTSYLRGAHYVPKLNKYRALCEPSGSDYSRHVGYFDTEEEAHLAYKDRKKTVGKILAARWADRIDPKALAALHLFIDNF